MPSGWDRHPEYGGPEPSWREAIGWGIAGIVLVGAVAVIVATTDLTLIEATLLMVTAMLTAAALPVLFTLDHEGRQERRLAKALGTRRWEIMRWSLVAALGILTIVLVALSRA
jgi:hypothetical protein